MHTQMNHYCDRLKRKYLRRAHQLLHNKSNKPPKWKLQASVEPFLHTSTGQTCPPPFERSASDPAKPSSSSYQNTRPDPHAWTAVTCGATDTCSESDTQSVHSPLPKGSTGYNSPFAASNSAHPHPMRHEVDPASSIRYHPHTRRTAHSHFPRVQTTDDMSTTSPSSQLLFVSPNDRSYKNLGGTTGGESAQLFDSLLYRSQDGPVPSEVYALASTPVARNRYHRMDMQENDHTLMAEKCSELDSKLKVQMKVNQELKRLLVASVGGDLQLRLEQVVQEKAHLSHDLETSLQQLTENNEDMDQISIECDIWRSKFLASRLMIDELASWKAELSLQYKESQRALQCLLKEHDELKNMLAKCNGILQEATEVLHHGRETSDSVCKLGQESSIISLKMLDQHFHSSHSTVLDLAQTSLNYAKAIQDKSQTLGTTSCVTKTPTFHSRNKQEGSSLHSAPIEPTVGEKLAKQVLISRQQFLKSQNRTFPLPLQLDDDKLLYERGVSQRGFSPLSGNSLLFGQLDSDTISYCRCCKGKVISV